MAERRTFAEMVIGSDTFLDMPLSSQALYFRLAIHADDDGFINNPKKLQRMVGYGRDNLKLLVVKKLILIFGSGMIVIKHWRVHNYIHSDHYKPALYQEKKDQIVEENSKAYTFKAELSVDDQPAGYQRLSQEGTVQSELDQSQGSSSESNCLEMVYHFYEENSFDTLASKTGQGFRYWLQDSIQKGTSQEGVCQLVLHALGITIGRDKRSYGYINAILKSWGQQSYLSVHEVLMNDKKQVLEHAP